MNNIVPRPGIYWGRNLILNWHEGPFFSMNRYRLYTRGPVIEELTNGGNVHTFPIADQTGEPIELSEISLTLTEIEGGYGYNIFQNVPVRENMSAEVFRSYYSGFDDILSFHDSNQNDLLDSGDHFVIRHLKNNTDYDFRIDKGQYNTIISWDFVVGIGEEIGSYPLLTMKSPRTIGGNISIDVVSVAARYPKLVSEYWNLKFNLTIPERDVNILLDPHEDGLAKNSTDDSISLEVIDSDENGYFTANDRIMIHGLDVGLDYNLKIHYGWDEAVIYEYDGVV